MIGKKEGPSEGVDTRGKETQGGLGRHKGEGETQGGERRHKGTQGGEVRHKGKGGDAKGRWETQGGERRDKGEKGSRHSKLITLGSYQKWTRVRTPFCRSLLE